MKHWFAYELMEDGYCLPRWYLPVYRDYDRRCHVCCHVVIWPFVMTWYIAGAVMRHLIKDMLDWLSIMNQLYKNKTRGGWFK